MINVIIITGAVQLHLKNERCACKKKLGIKNQQFLLVAVITAGVNFFYHTLLVLYYTFFLFLCLLAFVSSVVMLRSTYYLII